MSGTELIMGMEEVVQHIRELEKQNKALLSGFNELTTIADTRNKQNEKLKEENSAMKEALAQKFYKHYEEMDYNKLNVARTIGPDLGRMVDHLMAENKKLKKENDDYESEIDIYTNGMSLEEWHDDMEKQKAEITDEAERDIAHLEAENKRLKEYLEKEKKRLNDYVIQKAEAVERVIDGMKQENKKLKEDLEKAWDQRGDKWRKARIKNLEEENKRLQGEQLTEETAIRYVYENTDEYDDWVKGSTLYQELKEENKKLQEGNEDNLASLNFYTEQCAELKDERKQLKEEIRHHEDRKVADYDTRMNERKELKEEILYYQFYTYTLDKDGDCDLTKEDVDKFTEDEGQRKTLYERIGYEEEDSDSDEEDSDEEEEEGVITKLNGNKCKVPSEEECLQKFGISQGEFIMLAKHWDCSQL
jgi:hypothetical protein